MGQGGSVMREGGCGEQRETPSRPALWGEPAWGRKGVILARPQDTEGSRQPLPLTLGLLLSPALDPWVLA